MLIRRHFKIKGIVQGVGFRPFVYRLAAELSLAGWVRNTPAGVEIEVEGSADSLTAFSLRLASEAPPLSSISSIAEEDIVSSGDQGFKILPSAAGEAEIQVAPDAAICPNCLRELLDPADRRYLYSFINCTNCGPRYSIITGIHYDRTKTTMAKFAMCPECLCEYHNPADRRFHAQPNACPACGPQVRLLKSSPHNPEKPDLLPPLQGEGRGGDGVECLKSLKSALMALRGWTKNSKEFSDSGEGVVAVGRRAIEQTVAFLEAGKIIAVKGIGGYHLAVDACNDEAVQRLRERKHRDEKPFAVMASSLAHARLLAELSGTEEKLLSSPEAPIVIARKTADSPVSSLIAPDNDWLGLMLPYAPLHHLLFLNSAFKALVMTSANLSDEPIAYEDDDARQRLCDIADYFLVHDRPIHIRCDDSVIRVFQGKPLFYRRSRGYAPRSLQLPFAVAPVLAVGAELKGAICLAKGERAFPSQHIGDLQNSCTDTSFRQTIIHLTQILQIRPELIACDLHPDYQSSIYAEETGLPLVRVQHHHAHLASCMAENMLDGEVIGIILDGTGYGEDGTIWGGEFLVGGYEGFRRAGHFRPVPLPGGDLAVREPWRMAFSFLYQALGEKAFKLDHQITDKLGETEKSILRAMLERGINSPLTSSCGRLFDAVAALLNLRHKVSYDGQAAIGLEALAERADEGQRGNYNFKVIEYEKKPFQLDFTPIFSEILDQLRVGVQTPVIAHRFHTTVAEGAIACCMRIAEESGLERVVLSGGVFQNRLLTEMIYDGLCAKGLQVSTHRLIPPNDGGIAVGQTVVASRQSGTLK